MGQEPQKRQRLQEEGAHAAVQSEQTPAQSHWRPIFIEDLIERRFLGSHLQWTGAISIEETKNFRTISLADFTVVTDF
jgi:hypothetical protein